MAMPMKKSNNLRKASTAGKNVNMRLGTMEILIGFDPVLDSAVLPEEMEKPSQHCSLKKDEICCIFHGHDDISGFMEVD